MASREALLAVTESAYGTATSTPVLNTDKWYFLLPDSDSFQGLMQPVDQEIDYGGGMAIPFDVMADHYQTQINWRGHVYPALDNFLLNLALQRVGSSGTVPWTTTEPDGDLPSASLYKYWVARASATPVRKRFPGCKVQTLTLESTRQDPKLRFTASLVAQKEVGNPVDSSSDPDATEFPAPADTELPRGPYLHSHSSTNLSVGGSAVTNYDRLQVQVQNTLDVRWFENKYPAVVTMLGRTVTVTFQKLLASSPNFRQFRQTLADKATYVKYDNGTNSFKIDLGDQCHVSSYTQQLGKGQTFLETVTVKGRLDLSTGVDVALTFT